MKEQNSKCERCDREFGSITKSDILDFGLKPYIKIEGNQIYEVKKEFYFCPRCNYKNTIEIKTEIVSLFLYKFGNEIQKTIFLYL